MRITSKFQPSHRPRGTGGTRATSRSQHAAPPTSSCGRNEGAAEWVLWLRRGHQMLSVR